MFKFKTLFASMFLSAALFFAAGCDESTDPVDETELAPPTSGYVTLDQASSSFAIVGWSASTDENLDDFIGYIVTTYEVSASGAKTVKFDSVVVNKPTRSVTVNGLIAGKSYKSYIHSLLDNDDYSLALETNVYGGVVTKTGEEIDEMNSSASAQSGYGWNSAGAGEQYAYSSANASHIDIHCRKEGSTYVFYSPAALENPIAGARTTKFLSLSASDWSASSFTTEPNKNNVTVSDGDVLLLKNADGYYVKLKITDISAEGAAFATVTFSYKFQNVQGLRAAKQ